MKLNWKLLLPIGLGIWLVGKFMDSFLGGALALIGIIAFLMGIVDLVRMLVRGKKGKQEQEQTK